MTTSCSFSEFVFLPNDKKIAGPVAYAHWMHGDGSAVRSYIGPVQYGSMILDDAAEVMLRKINDMIAQIDSSQVVTRIEAAICPPMSEEGSDDPRCRDGVTDVLNYVAFSADGRTAIVLQDEGFAPPVYYASSSVPALTNGAVTF